MKLKNQHAVESEDQYYLRIVRNRTRKGDVLLAGLAMIALFAASVFLL